MKIEIYDTIECKSKNYQIDNDLYVSECKNKESQNRNTIRNKECFDKFFEKYKQNSKSPNYFFRGMNEAKYKLYTSGQRHWLTYDLETIYSNLTPQTDYEKFVSQQIINARKKGLKKFYNNLRYKPYDHTILSFLQHYGGVTPFLDWTESIRVALYFAVDGLKQIATDNEIDNYFSIYVIKSSNIKDFNSLIEGDTTLNMNNNEEKIINKTFNLNQQQHQHQPYFLKWSIYPYSRKKKPLLININRENLNIINQKGLFIFNPDYKKPLEQIMPTKITCYDIHKSLSEYIRQKINITKDFIYPQEEEIAKSALLEVRKKIK